MIHDFIVIGAGILGLSTARQLQSEFPGASILVLEKEDAPARHQTGRNSGVIHAGVYYAPGSLKARFCREGNRALKDFCLQQDIPFEECGKLLVATDETELGRMAGLIERCRANEIPIEVLGAQDLKSREPAVTGLGAVFVPSTGILSYTRVSLRLAELFVQDGGELRLGASVVGMKEGRECVSVTTGTGIFQGRRLVACAGLQSDRIARMLGLELDFRIVPFRGDYYRLAPRHDRVVRHLIYPIPDPELPFLGVHLTRMIEGCVTVGPNAVLAFQREGYGRFDFDFHDSLEMLTYPGLMRFLASNLRLSLSELKNSLWKPGYLKRVHKYCPGIALKDLMEYPSGIRAQAVTASGGLVSDFLFASTPRALVVCNAPSPAATSAFPISRHIVERVKMLDESGQ